VRLARVERSPLRTGSSDAPAEPRASSDAERSATELVAAEPPEEPARGAQDDAQDSAPTRAAPAEEARAPRTVAGVAHWLRAALPERYGELTAAELLALEELDPRVYLLAIGALVLIVGAACAVPALRATRVEPVDVLRAD
jgi:hypothetical protein